MLSNGHASAMRRLSHAPAGQLKAYREALPALAPLEFYPLATVSHENHTAVVGKPAPANRC